MARYRLNTIPEGVALCSNCEIEKAQRKGKCNRCYFYKFRTGQERPKHLEEIVQHQKIKPKWCKNCFIYTGAAVRCNACRNYLRRTGRERPRAKWDKEHGCATCGIPLSGQVTYCEPCRRYRKRYGSPRPKHLWGSGILGWCECSQPAEHQGKYFNLCKSCFQIEQELNNGNTNRHTTGNHTVYDCSQYKQSLQR